MKLFLFLFRRFASLLSFLILTMISSFRIAECQCTSRFYSAMASRRLMKAPFFAQNPHSLINNVNTRITTRLFSEVNEDCSVIAAYYSCWSGSKRNLIDYFRIFSFFVYHINFPTEIIATTTFIIGCQG